MLALALGTLLAIGALAFVLYPLLVGAEPRVFARPVRAKPARAEELEAVVALREIEFDRETGKLSHSDYAELKARYTARALAAMRGAAGAAAVGGVAGVAGAAGAVGTASGDDAIEAAVLAYRANVKQCATCGPRPEPDAVYCSNCGSYLPGECSACGAHVAEPGAAFCASCGRQLAA